MKLLTELSHSVKSEINESAGQKNFYIKGIFAQAVNPNRNFRVYTKPVLESAVTKFMSLVQSKRALGELNHPTGPTINLDRVSHIIENLEWDGDNVLGVAKVIDTPMGNIARKIMEAGAQLGVSTRGVGSLRKMNNGISEVQNDYILNTIDIVGDPSAHDAWVQGILEGKEWFIDDDGILQEKMVKRIKQIKKIDEARLLKEFKLFLDSVATLSENGR
jgi:hypothetical protein